MNKTSQELPILIILPDFENCKGFQSTYMPNQCENPSLHKGCAALILCLLENSCTQILNFGFLDASSHFYNRVCPSVRWSVGPSVG